MLAASIVLDYNQRISEFAIHGSCPAGCYNPFRTLKSIVEGRWSYNACVRIPVGATTVPKHRLMVMNALSRRDGFVAWDEIRATIQADNKIDMKKSEPFCRAALLKLTQCEPSPIVDSKCVDGVKVFRLNDEHRNLKVKRLATQTSKILHRLLPVMIGSALDHSIRTDVKLEDEMGYIIISGQTHIVNSFCSNNTRGMFKFSSSHVSPIFPSNQVKDYIKITLQSMWAEYVNIHYGGQQDGFVVTSSHADVMNGKEQYSPMRLYSDSNFKPRPGMKFNAEDVVENFNLEGFLKQENMFSQEFSLDDMRHLLDDLLKHPANIDSMAGNKLMSTPGRNFFDVLAFFVPDIRSAEDKQRLFREGFQYSANYKGHPLDKGLMHTPLNEKNLRNRLETGVFQDILVSPRFSLLTLKDRRIPGHTRKNVAVVSNYDSLPGPKQDSIEDAMHRTKRARGVANKQTGVEENCFPKDAMHFLCPCGTKNMKKAGSTLDLAVGAFIALPTDRTILRDFLNVHRSGRYRVAVECHLTNCRFNEPHKFIKLLKSKFPQINGRLLDDHLILYPHGGSVMKWSSNWKMHVSPMEAMTYAKVFPDTAFEGAPFLSLLGPYTLAMPYHSENVAPHKIAVSINNIRGGALKPDDTSRPLSEAKSGFNTVAVLKGEGENCKRSDVLDLTSKSCRPPRSHKERRLVRRMQSTYWAEMKKKRGDREVVPNTENPNLCGFAFQDVWQRGQDDVKDAISAFRSHTNSCQIRNPTLMSTDSPTTINESFSTVLRAHDMGITRDRSPKPVGGNLCLHSVCDFDGGPFARMAVDSDKRNHAPHAILYGAFADIEGATNEDAIVLEENLSDHFKYESQCIQIVRLEPIVTRGSGGVNPALAEGIQSIQYRPSGCRVDGIIVFGVIVSSVRLKVMKKSIVKCAEHRRGLQWHYLLTLQSAPTVCAADWKVTSQLVKHDIPKKTKRVLMQMPFVKLTMSAIRPVGKGSKLATTLGQKGIVTKVHPIHKMEQFKGVTENGMIVTPQIIFTPTSVIGRSTVLQFKGGMNGHYAITETGGIIYDMGILLSCITAEKVCLGGFHNLFFKVPSTHISFFSFTVQQVWETGQ